MGGIIPEKERTLHVEYFSITTLKPEQFLTEIDKLCQKFAVKEKDGGLKYGYNWGIDEEP